MEIYKETNTAETKEFEKLLNNQISKTKNLVEGKIIEGTVTKVGEKYVFLFIEGLKSEPLIDINELKSLGQESKLKIGEKVQVLLERIEDKNGEVVVSASKAQKIKGWDILVKAFENNQPIMGKITSKCKGGVIVEHIDTGSLMFCPGSQISDIPIKDISHLINEPQKFALIKMDKIRGNACVSRRQIISSGKKEDKAKIIEKYKLGDFASEVTIDHRRSLDRVQRELREYPGTSVLIYDQTCAAEKRRKRKSGRMIDPPRRLFVNDLVCEGCGDCSVQSNCLSVVPVETEFGRKRTIDQSSCNKDYSCLNGFCPSFVTVEGGSRRKRSGAGLDVAGLSAQLPMPRN